MELTKDEILELASKCEATKTFLEKKFPEMFGDFDLSKLLDVKCFPEIFSNEKSKEAGFNDRSFMQIRDGGTYKNKAFYLSDKYDWRLERDDWEFLCLIPSKKQFK